MRRMPSSAGWTVKASDMAPMMGGVDLPHVLGEGDGLAERERPLHEPPPAEHVDEHLHGRGEHPHELRRRSREGALPDTRLLEPLPAGKHPLPFLCPSPAEPYLLASPDRLVELAGPVGARLKGRVDRLAKRGGGPGDEEAEQEARDARQGQDHDVHRREDRDREGRLEKCPQPAEVAW